MNPSRPKRQRLGFESGFLSKRMKRVKLRENDADERRRAFKTPEHASDVLNALRRLRDTNAMCDIELSVANRTFRAHKLVLVATIPYLKAMLSSGMRESRQETIELKSIDPDAFETILDYAYTGEVVVSDENVQDLLPAASMLQIESLRDACCKFLEEQIEPGNCLGIGSFADVHGCVELVDEVDRFVCRRFVDVARCEEFLGLGWEDAKELLMKDGLQVRSEKAVYEAARNWLLHDFPSRRKHVAEILHETVRLPLLKRDYLLATVLNDEIIESNVEHQAFVRGIAAAVSSADNPSMKHRVPPETVYVVGGRNSRHCLNTAEKYDIEENKWKVVPPMMQVRTAVGMATVDGVLYVVGGECETAESRDGTQYLSSCEKFDPKESKWVAIAPMSRERSFVGVTSLDGYLYVFGGEDAQNCYSTAERYDPQTNEWTALPEMRLNRSGAGVAVLDDKIYVVGGHDHAIHHSSVEIFDPVDNTWSFGADMTLARAGVGVCVVDNTLYAFGGRNRSVNVYYDVAEKFEVMTNRWERLPHMHSIRAWPAVAVRGGMAYVCGGYDGRSRLATVECFDPRMSEWKILRAMVDSRAGAAAAVA